MIEGEETQENFFSSGGADRRADAIIFRKSPNIMEIVTEVEVLPTVGVADREAEFKV